MNFEFKGVKFTDTFCLNTMNISLLISEVENPNILVKQGIQQLKIKQNCTNQISEWFIS